MRRILCLSIFIVCLILTGMVSWSIAQTATLSPVVDVYTPQSTIYETSDTLRFFLTSNNGPLFTTSVENQAGASEFVQQNPDIESLDVQGESTVLSTKSIKRKLLPASIRNTAKLLKRESDSVKGTQRFIFGQIIDSYPVYGAQLSVHMRNKKEIYALAGSMTKRPESTPEILTIQQANTIALAEAQKEYSSVTIQTAGKIIFNYAVIGASTDATNYKAAKVAVTDPSTIPRFARLYIVSLQDGKILHTEELIHTAISRGVYDCSGGITSCTLVRREGEPPAQIADADALYAYFGDTYNYFKTTYNADSYDGAGSAMKGLVNVTTQIKCPNALWSRGPDNQFVFCSDMVAPDIVAHEFTHAITEHTAKLVSFKQSGALDEAISDIFAFMVDPDWTVGEGSALGVIRDARNPPQDPGGHPDRLFSSLYKCTEADQGGIHSNMTVVTKAFYLMSEGGAFNGCQIAGIGKDKSAQIWWRALQVYLLESSNFDYAYRSVMQACGDLYGLSSTTCTAVLKSFQATEMDQQPESLQDGARCLNRPRVIPQCALTVSPTVVVTMTPSPTGGVGLCQRKSQGDATCDGVVDLIDFEVWRKEHFSACSQSAPHNCQTDEDGDGQLMDANYNFPGSGQVFIDTLVNLLDFESWRKTFFAR